jgi:hypothetical protein
MTTDPHDPADIDSDAKADSKAWLAIGALVTAWLVIQRFRAKRGNVGHS